MKQADADGRGHDGGDLLFRFFRHQLLEGCEQSFKLADRTLLANRWLLGVTRRALAPDSLASLCRKMAIPVPYLHDFMARLPEADIVHFGFEEGERAFIYKVYLEYAGRLRRADAGHAGHAGPLLLHRAYKWDVLDPGRQTIAYYHCHPGLSVEAMLDRIARISLGRPQSLALATVKAIIALASSRSSEPPMYLEVTEEGNPRLSFDINLHAADLCLADIEPQIMPLCTQYAIPAAQIQSLYDRIRTRKLGHLSGGTSRDGGEFLTVYYEPGERA